MLCYVLERWDRQRKLSPILLSVHDNFLSADCLAAALQTAMQCNSNSIPTIAVSLCRYALALIDERWYNPSLCNVYTKWQNQLSVCKSQKASTSRTRTEVAAPHPPALHSATLLWLSHLVSQASVIVSISVLWMKTLPFLSSHLWICRLRLNTWMKWSLSMSKYHHLERLRNFYARACELWIHLLFILDLQSANPHLNSEVISLITPAAAKRACRFSHEKIWKSKWKVEKVKDRKSVV